jgi:hypothetical protein
MSSVLGSKSKAAIFIINLNTTPAFSGRLILNKGINTIIYWVLIIDHKLFSEADRAKLKAKVTRPITAVPPSTAASCAGESSIYLSPNYGGIS